VELPSIAIETAKPGIGPNTRRFVETRILTQTQWNFNHATPTSVLILCQSVLIARRHRISSRIARDVELPSIAIETAKPGIGPNTRRFVETRILTQTQWNFNHATPTSVLILCQSVLIARRHRISSRIARDVELPSIAIETAKPGIGPNTRKFVEARILAQTQWNFNHVTPTSMLILCQNVLIARRHRISSRTVRDVELPSIAIETAKPGIGPNT
jgi:uncharacterized membrane protein YfbV (UPF0208 family)